MIIDRVGLYGFCRPMKAVQYEFKADQKLTNDGNILFRSVKFVEVHYFRYNTQKRQNSTTWPTFNEIFMILGLQPPVEPHGQGVGVRTFHMLNNIS